MNMLDSWSLRVLLAVAKGGSFSAAAGELQMTQPAVSRQIAALERRLGVSLFQRLPRGVRPTAAGNVAIEQAHLVVHGMVLLERRMRSMARAESGEVRVSAFASVATQLVPEAIRTFARTNPDVDLSVVSRHGGGDPSRDVLEGRIDVALVTNWDPDPVPGCETITLAEDEQLVALAKDHPLADRPRVRLRDLADESWIEGSHPDCLGPIPELATALGAPPRITSICDDWSGKQGLVAAGIGVMLYPALAGRSALRPDIRLVHPSPRLPRRILRAVVLPEPSRAPVVTSFIPVLRDVASTLIA